MIVRYQADKLPHVKRVDISSIQLKNTLSRNMPRMEEVSSCPVELLPNDEWQNDILYKFSELRLVCVYIYIYICTYECNHSAHSIGCQHYEHCSTHTTSLCLCLRIASLLTCAIET